VIWKIAFACLSVLLSAPRSLFLPAGYSVLLVDLQATGETIGRNITFGWLRSRDVVTAVNFAHTTSPHLPSS
jgi:hypothetical protein